MTLSYPPAPHAGKVLACLWGLLCKEGLTRKKSGRAYNKTGHIALIKKLTH